MEGMSNSGLRVLGLVKEYTPFNSVLDVGCGQGAWLAAAESLGAQRVKGFDGDWVSADALRSPNIEFEAVNLDQSIPELEEKFDLAMSLEVAEHVSEANAKNFVDLLCKASDTVLFGAAIEHQGGVNHINEQRQSYWIDLFAKNGYRCFDVLRPVVWNDSSVEVWYRQNTFLFVGPENRSISIQDLEAAEKPIPDVVHPDLFASKMPDEIELPDTSIEQLANNPDFRFLFKTFSRYLRATGRRLRGKL